MILSGTATEAVSTRRMAELARELSDTRDYLQSIQEQYEAANEELTTVNEEMIRRNADLGQLNADRVNFESAANLTVVSVGSDITIHRYSGRAAKQFDLFPSDIGRPITGIQHNLDVPDRNRAWNATGCGGQRVSQANSSPPPNASTISSPMC